MPLLWPRHYGHVDLEFGPCQAIELGLTPYRSEDGKDSMACPLSHVLPPTDPPAEIVYPFLSASSRPPPHRLYQETSQAPIW